MSTVESNHYIYTLNLIDYDAASGEPTMCTWLAFEHLSDAIDEANLWWAANRYAAYGTATVATHNTINTPEQALYRLESNEDNFRSRSQEYRKQVLQVARVWLDLDGVTLKTVRQRVALKQKEEKEMERAEKSREREKESALED
ncbi:hypothetical protein LTR85_010370 [Meristemomyces frigidus]|nr:hypothetical protein LTR85_010370 [Meristemomyces frigidus]